VWRYPGGGKVFVHNGDPIHWFQSDAATEPNLTRDILEALADPDVGPFDVPQGGAGPQ
jgi:hypothetical protein